MLSIVVIGESDADARVATGLADRVFLDAVESLDSDPSKLEHFREWVRDELGRFLTWSQVSKAGFPSRARIHGKFNNQPAAADAHATRRAFVVLRQRELEVGRPFDGVLLYRDGDDQYSKRKTGIQQALRERKHPDHWKIVIGLANTKLECWLLSGFSPQTNEEAAKLAEQRQQLGYFPNEQAHLLTAKNTSGKHNAKRVLEALTGNDFERRQDCWSKAPMEVLERRGVESGLTEFLTSVREQWCSQSG